MGKGFEKLSAFAILCTDLRGKFLMVAIKEALPDRMGQRHQKKPGPKTRLF